LVRAQRGALWLRIAFSCISSLKALAGEDGIDRRKAPFWSYHRIELHHSRAKSIATLLGRALGGPTSPVLPRFPIQP
jgi:hypothetical protein